VVGRNGRWTTRGTQRTRTEVDCRRPAADRNGGRANVDGDRYAPRSKRGAKGQKQRRVPTTTAPAMAMAPMAADAAPVGHIGGVVEQRGWRLTASPSGSGCGGYLRGTARRRPRNAAATREGADAHVCPSLRGPHTPAAVRAAARRGRPPVPSLPWSAMASPPPPLRGAPPPFGSPPPSPPGGGRAPQALRRLGAPDGPPPPTDAAVMRTNDDAAASKASAMAMYVNGRRFFFMRLGVRESNVAGGGSVRIEQTRWRQEPPCTAAAARLTTPPLPPGSVSRPLLWRWPDCLSLVPALFPARPPAVVTPQGLPRRPVPRALCRRPSPPGRRRAEQRPPPRPPPRAAHQPGHRHPRGRRRRGARRLLRRRRCRHRRRRRRRADRRPPPATGAVARRRV